MINRPFSTVLARLGLVAAVLATLLILAPVASAATELTYEEGGTDPVATLSATDEDGDAIDWSLTGDDASKFKISDDGVLEFKDSPNYESPGDKNKNNVYLVSVNASETSTPLDLEITVTDKDEDGKVSLTQPQPQVGRGLVASLSDQDADVEDEKWQWARGETADGPWTDIDKATTASRSPVADDWNMYLRATVTYEDKFDTGKTASAVTENSVEDRTRANSAPSFSGLDETTGDDAETPNVIVVTRDVDEGVKGVNVGKPIAASDTDNDVLLYTIDKASQAKFTIDSRSGQLKTKVDTLNSDDDGLTGDDDPINDAEDLTGLAGGGEARQVVMVTATDPSGAPATQSVTITINDVNDAPKFDKYAPTAVGAAENNNNATALTVEENTIALDRTPQTADDTVVVVPTYLAADADAGDDATTDATAEPPTVALTYEVMGADKSAFVSPLTLDSDGVATLAFKSDHKVNFEGKDEYEITIVASDDSAPEGTGTVDVTITVVNAEDMGVVTPTQREPQVGKEVVAALSDQDGNIRGQEWQWYRHVVADNPATPDTDEETDLSTITAVCGAAGTTEGAPCVIGGATSPNYTPVMADLAPLDDNTADDTTDREDRRLAARVTYTDAHVTKDVDGDPVDDSMQVVLQAPVEVENPANSAPKFRDDQDANTPGDQADASRSVPENAKGMAVGDPVTASDSGDLLIYSLSGADSESFTVESGLKSGDTPGLIKTAVKLDYETKDMYMVVVTATDPSGATDTINVNIEVIDEDDKTVIALGAAVNTPPAFATDTATRSVDENMYAGAAVGDPVTAMDAGDTVTYTLSGSTYFGIDGSSGQISTTMMLDHEAMSTHTVTVTATDSEDATDTVDVTINVNDAHPGCTYELVDTGELILGLTNDCEALLDAKEDLGGDLSWSGDTNIVEWDGVTVTYFVDVGVASSRVRRIWLRGAGLDGSVSAALGRLEMLRVLNLHSNNLSGPIPDLSGTMLQELYLNNNYDEDVAGSGLTGGVPAWLNTMTDMTELWLWGNQLTGALPDLSGMTSLEKLKLNGNAVSGFDAAMLPSGLRWLIAGETDMGSTAPDLSGMTSLTTLWMNENGLTGAVPVASIPTSVTSLNLKGNALSGTIPDMSGLTNLEYLRLHRNELSGHIPGTLGDLDSIERIWLYENDLTGISVGLANASDTLTHLYLNGNSFAEGTCLPGDLATSVANNDFDDAGLAACGDGS